MLERQDVVTTSIGRRSADRGNIQALSLFLLNQRTSIGPRSADRGNGGRDSAAWYDPQLQLGRDQLIAEIILSSIAVHSCSALQLVRDQLIADMRHFSLLRLIRSRLPL